MSRDAPKAARARGRASYERRAWGDAWTELAAADRGAPLPPEDLERLATAGHFLGREADSAALWARAHREFLRRGEAARAARCAVRLAIPLMLRGEAARGGGWVARGLRLLGGLDCVEQGYLLLPPAIRALLAGDAEGAAATFGEAVRIGERFGETDLVALARHGQGRALIRKGETARGVALLDEVMAAALAGEVSPGVVGDVYCSVLEGCGEIHDLKRAREWTEALSEWTASQGDVPAYRGQCLVHRAEILQVGGAWTEALAEAEKARAFLSEPPPQRAVGAAHYRLAELHRLRGEGAEAEEAFRKAAQSGRSPQPGLALLRLAQGRVTAARAAIRLALDAALERGERARLLAAGVEIALAAGDLPGARAAADELTSIATFFGTPYFGAAAAHAAGAVVLAEGDARRAAVDLGRAVAAWGELEAPYDAARARVLLGLACRALGDDDAARLELDVARTAFERLGASPDRARAAELAREAPVEGAPALTGREVEVLRLVATGRTNRAIAGALGISEKTVARHVSNIFTKLDLPSRAAATAYAYRHGLVAADT